MQKSNLIVLIAVLLFAGFAVGLRVVALESDAYRGLSWDTGLFTDEGYYMHNARNVVLYHQVKTDEFNNMLLMPTLHYLQIAVFKVFGVGLAQTRAISVVFSLATLFVFWIALNRAFDEQVASIATLFLGLDHINLLYNRMGLMDTPAAFVMVCAFYALMRCFCYVDRDDAGKHTRRWAIGSGVLLGLVYATRGLGAIMIPAPFLAYWFLGREDYRLDTEKGRILGGILGGMCAVLLLYALLWYLPNREAIRHANHYHLSFQLAPHSLAHLWRNISQALSGQKFLGLAPYLFRYSPIQFGLVLLFFAAYGFQKPMSHRAKFTIGVAGLWLLAGWLLFCVVNYAPSRYYVLVYPAMATLSAVSLVYFKDLWEVLLSRRLVRSLLAGFFTYQGALLVWEWLHRAPSSLPTVVALCVLMGVFLLPTAPTYDHYALRPLGSASMVLLLLWCAVNGGWYVDWWRNLRYTHIGASNWLGQNLPPNSVLIGDCAPGLCVTNRLRCVNVIPDLCNDKETLDRWKGSPIYIAILDGSAKEVWWLEHYPKAVANENRITLFAPLVSHTVGVYRVDAVR